MGVFALFFFMTDKLLSIFCKKGLQKCGDCGIIFLAVTDMPL